MQTEAMRKSSRLKQLRDRAEALGLNAKAILRDAEDRVVSIRDRKNLLANVLLAIENIYRRVKQCTLIKRQGFQQTMDVNKAEDMRLMMTLVGDYICDLQYASETVRKQRAAASGAAAGGGVTFASVTPFASAAVASAASAPQ